MASIEERLSTIEQSVLETAREKSLAIRQEADSARAKELEKAENEVLQELYDKIQEEISDIHGNVVKNISKQETNLRRELLLRREEITNEVFEHVKVKLLAYTATSEYEAYMMKTADDLARQYTYSDSVIQLRSKDYYLAAKISDKIGNNCRVIACDDIKIGGMRLMNQSFGLFVDETLDSKLEEQRPWFYSHSGLTIV